MPMCQEFVVKLFGIVAFTQIADNTIIRMSGLFVGLIASYFMTQENALMYLKTFLFQKGRECHF